MKNFRLMFLMSMLSIFIFSCSSSPNMQLASVNHTFITVNNEQDGSNLITSIENEITDSQFNINADASFVNDKINVQSEDYSAIRRDKSLNYFASRSVSNEVSKISNQTNVSHNIREYG